VSAKTDVVMAALEAMTRGLHFVFRTPEKPGVNHVTAVQARYALALADNVAKFMRDAGVGDDIAQRFEELATAILGLRRGIVTDPVRAAEIGGRSSDGLTAWLLRADIVLGLECLIRSQKFNTLKKAAQHVAKRFPKEFDRLKRNPGDDLASSILSWRTRINKRKAPGGDNILAYQHRFFEDHGHLSHDEWIAEAERVLAEAARATAVATSL
jgi:hypothetical protein